MKNIDVFKDFDMVVCITQKTLNDQLLHLTKLGMIPDQLTIAELEVGDDVEYRLVSSVDEIANIPNATGAYVSGDVRYLVNVPKSGYAVDLVIRFTGGEAALWIGKARPRLTSFPNIKDWQWGLTVDLNLKELDRRKQGAIPPHVADQLSKFQSNMFRVQHLFMDFESTDLSAYDPKALLVPGAGTLALEPFASFMTGYMKYLTDKKNPFILGYSVERTPQTSDPDASVPGKLKPVGTTFNVFCDAATPDRSTVNFVLVTKDGHGKIAGSPSNFDENWLKTTDKDCSGKLIYASSCLIEEYVLKPIFKKLRDDLYIQIRDGLDPPVGKDFAAARTFTPTGMKFDISNVTGGNETDEYVNNYTVDIKPLANDRLQLDFKGHIFIKKTKKIDVGAGTARGWGSATVDWKGPVTIIASVKDGKPVLSLESNLVFDPPQRNSWTNEWADAMDVIGKILSFIPSFITLLASFLIMELGTVQIPQVGNISDLFTGLPKLLQTTFILPAGQVFYFKNPACDPYGNLSLLVTYKSET